MSLDNALLILGANAGARRSDFLQVHKEKNKAG